MIRVPLRGWGTADLWGSKLIPGSWLEPTPASLYSPVSTLLISMRVNSRIDRLISEKPSTILGAPDN